MDVRCIFCVVVFVLVRLGIDRNELQLMDVIDVVVVGGEKYYSFGVLFLFVFFENCIIFYIF